MREAVSFALIFGLAAGFAFFGLGRVLDGGSDGAHQAEVRRQLFCEGYAQGVTVAFVGQGYYGPQRNEFEAMVSTCLERKTYLEPPLIETGPRPAEGREQLLDDEGLLPPRLVEPGLNCDTTQGAC